MTPEAPPPVGMCMLTHGGKKWTISADPHVLIGLKRWFQKIDKSELGEVTLTRNAEVDADLQWMLEKFPLELSGRDAAEMARGAEEHRNRARLLRRMMAADYVPSSCDQMAHPPRDYQRLAADHWISARGMLLGDALGLGKTVSAIAGLSRPETRPAIIVCPVHLLTQWAEELRLFLPGTRSHIIKSTSPYDVAAEARKDARRRHELWPDGPNGGPVYPDFVITAYTRLDGWIDTLAPRHKSVVFDEVQELHRAYDGADYTKKYAAARALARAMEYCLGLSAGPIEGYGGEAFNVFDVLRPGELGSRAEFRREWTTGGEERKTMIADPRAFGLHLQATGALLRRTRKDVERELPPQQIIVHRLDVDQAVIDRNAGGAAELARIILAQNGGSTSGREKRDAAGELDRIMRQATGIAKAPHIAAFLRMIVETGEPVICALWHREVYAIIMEALADLTPAMYTGSESPKQKREAFEAFVGGETKVLLMSLRSGSGLNGLERVCRTPVIGELDWSPKKHEQFIGRTDRERRGEQLGITAYYLLSTTGSDPVVADVLNLKNSQSRPIMDPKLDTFLGATVDPEHMRRLAQACLARHGGR